MSYRIELPFDPPSSPGYLWSANGIINAGSFLRNAEIPSNSVGLVVPVSGGELKEVYVINKNAATFQVEVMRKIAGVPTSFSPPAVVTITAQRFVTSTFNNLIVDLGDELLVKMLSGVAEDVIVGALIKRAGS